MSGKTDTDKYSLGVRFNHQMGTLEVLSFVGEGVGATLYILAVALGRPHIAILGIAFVIFAVLVLRAHLGQPGRAWRAMKRLVTSTVSRGTLLISGFLGFSTLSVAAHYIGFLQPLQALLTVAALIFAVPVILYAGFLLRSMKAITFWRGFLVPAAFAAHSLATAMTIVLALIAWRGVNQVSYDWLQPVGLGTLLLAVVMSLVHLYGVERTAGTQASIHRIRKGNLSGRFTWGAGVIGIAIPFVVWLVVYVLGPILGDVAAGAVFALAALCRLYGDYAYRSCVVVAGAYEPLLPASGNLPRFLARSSTPVSAAARH